MFVAVVDSSWNWIGCTIFGNSFTSEVTSSGTLSKIREIGIDRQAVWHLAPNPVFAFNSLLAIRHGRVVEFHQLTRDMLLQE